MRQSGILLPLPSLPSRWGIGGMGAEAEAFANYLQDCGQRLWQVLPMTVPDFVHSPYASPSAFAGNPMLLDIPLLAADGWLTPQEAAPPSQACFTSVAYRFGEREKDSRLRLAYSRFCRSGRVAEYEAFCRREAQWLPDYALFAALKSHFGGDPFWLWPDADAARHETDALNRYRDALSEEIAYRCFTQFLFDSQLNRLKQILRRKNISLIGDIPFYVARDSADVWAHPELFVLDGDRSPREVAGVPPDYFSATGQLWGNPLYNWRRMRQDGYGFWMRRLSRCAALYDITRLDHFRAFDSYYAIPGGAEDAREGAWRRGPGRAFFATLRAKLPGISLIAEDLGELSESVHRLRRDSGLPGMRVLQFAFDGEDNSFLPHNYDRHTVVYLGTHDNDTSAGWWRSLGEEERSRAAAYLGISPKSSAREAVRRMMAAASASVGDTVIFTLQDVCGAGKRARINTPGEAGGCWRYAAPPGFSSPEDGARLREITQIYGRNP